MALHPTIKKLNYKNQKTLVILQSPQSFDEVLDQVPEGVTIKKKITGVKSIEFVLVFVQKQKEIDQWIPKLAPKLEGDAVIWMCYPKKSSKKYQCDFNRDNGWAIMGKYDLEGVRQVAIDEDWSALRFRKVEYIKTMKRKFDALSQAGKKKAGQK